MVDKDVGRAWWSREDPPPAEPWEMPTNYESTSSSSREKSQQESTRNQPRSSRHPATAASFVDSGVSEDTVTYDDLRRKHRESQINIVPPPSSLSSSSSAAAAATDNKIPRRTNRYGDPICEDS